MATASSYEDRSGRQRVSFGFREVALSSGAATSTFSTATLTAGACPTGCTCTPGSDLDTFVQSSDPQYTPLAPLLRLDTLAHGALAQGGGGGGGGGVDVSTVRARGRFSVKSVCAFQSLVGAVVHGKITFHTAAPGSTPQAPFYDTSVEGKCSTVMQQVTVTGSASGVEAHFDTFLGAFVYTSREKQTDGGVAETSAMWSQILASPTDTCQ